jgi:uncharacterized protein (TIGR02996 family)
VADVNVNESSLLEAIKADKTEGSRLVYADWLEEHGDTERAEFVRIESELFRRGPSAPHDGAFFRWRHRLEDLSKRLDRAWLDKVLRWSPSSVAATATGARAPAPATSDLSPALEPPVATPTAGGLGQTHVRSIFDVGVEEAPLPTSKPLSSKLLIAFLVVAAIALAYASIRDRMKNDHYINLDKHPSLSQ